MRLVGIEEREQVNQNLALLWSRAFVEKPLFQHVLSCVQGRDKLDRLQWIMFRKALLCTGKFKADLVEQGRKGCFLWVPPGLTGGLNPLHFFRVGLLKAPFILGTEPIKRLLQVVEHEQKALAQYRSSNCWVLDIAAIDNSLQGQGIGTERLGKTLKFIRDRGEIALVMTNNLGALRFYQKNGFEIQAHSKIADSDIDSWVLKTA